MKLQTGHWFPAREQRHGQILRRPCSGIGSAIGMRYTQGFLEDVSTIVLKVWLKVTSCLGSSIRKTEGSSRLVPTHPDVLPGRGQDMVFVSRLVSKSLVAI